MTEARFEVIDLPHNCEYGKREVILLGTLDTPRGPAKMFACGDCTRLFFFADFDFDPITGEEA